MFKKIYIEITNSCNLKCSFCNINHTKRAKQEMTVAQFEHLLQEINPYTDYLYLHILGEPLLHSELDKILFLCRAYHKKVNITTNGTLLNKKISLITKYQDLIRQINISLHAKLKDQRYLADVMHSISNLSNTNIIFSLRLWNIQNHLDQNKPIYQFLKDKLNLEDHVYESLFTNKQIKLRKNLYLDKANTFIWPNLDNNLPPITGKCYGTITHLGILSDGTVIPCCLDSDGLINLGNIFTESFSDIIKKKRYQDLHDNLKKGLRCEKLCQQCNFVETLHN